MPSRDKHHDICDLRCFAAGNIAMRSVKHQGDAPAWAPLFSSSANGLRHSLAERYPMKLFLPTPWSLGIVRVGRLVFIVVLCFVFELGLKDKWLKTPVFTISFFSVPSI